MDTISRLWEFLLWFYVRIVLNVYVFCGYHTRSVEWTTAEAAARRRQSLLVSMSRPKWWAKQLTKFQKYAFAGVGCRPRAFSQVHETPKWDTRESCLRLLRVAIRSQLNRWCSLRNSKSHLAAIKLRISAVKEEEKEGTEYIKNQIFIEMILHHAELQRKHIRFGFHFACVWSFAFFSFFHFLNSYWWAICLAMTTFHLSKFRFLPFNVFFNDLRWMQTSRVWIIQIYTSILWTTDALHSAHHQKNSSWSLDHSYQTTNHLHSHCNQRWFDKSNKNHPRAHTQ